MGLRVTGLDMSITGTGVCRPDGSTYTITTKAKKDDRLTDIRDQIMGVHVSGGTDLIVLEDVPGKMIGAASVVIPMLHGSVRSALKDARIPYVIVSPPTLKKFATGRGNADKSAMILAAFKRAEIEFRDNNQCDAWWLWIAGLTRCTGITPAGLLPAAQRAALDVVDWSPAQPVTAIIRGRETAV